MMKSKFIIYLLIITTSIQLSAQSTKDRSYFKFGPKVGLDFNVHNNNLPLRAEISNQLTDNYQFGAFLQMGKKLYFQPEFMYAVINTIDDFDTPTLLEFFKIPVHVGLKFFDIGLLSLHISGGAVYSHKIGDAVSFEKEKINYQLGVGVDIFDFVTTDLRYTLNKGVSLNDQSDNFKSQGGTINLTVGLKL